MKNNASHSVKNYTLYRLAVANDQNHNIYNLHAIRSYLETVKLQALYFTNVIPIN